uniref:NADH-ubiquinone oxidoreductase chain 4L n=1 Tax=Stereophaedusa tokunoshimaensis TaxID=1885814 RepID=A0A224AD82_9EUPU|nr:NADH dehydrogenase subunit 4L [Stereophaedusa tokunoshimaensis]
MVFYNYLFVLMVLLVFFLFNTKTHFMRVILILEAIMLTALIISIFLLSMVQKEPYVFLLLLTFAVVEAALGLSLLLSYMKSTGSDVITNNVFN